MCTYLICDVGDVQGASLSSQWRVDESTRRVKLWRNLLLVVCSYVLVVVLLSVWVKVILNWWKFSRKYFEHMSNY